MMRSYGVAKIVLVFDGQRLPLKVQPSSKWGERLEMFTGGENGS